MKISLQPFVLSCCFVAALLPGSAAWGQAFARGHQAPGVTVLGAGAVTVAWPLWTAPVIEAPLVDGRPFLGLAIGKDLLGVTVTEVVHGSAGDRAGFLPGDHIVEIDGGEIETPGDVVLAIDQHLPGRPLELVVIRHNKRSVRRIQFVPVVPMAFPIVAPAARPGDRTPIRKIPMDKMPLRKSPHEETAAGRVPANRVVAPPTR